jgi:hypothetical protein
METDTQPYVVVDGKKYDTKGLKWSHREKSFVKDKINIVPNDAPNVEFGGSEKKEKSQKSPDQETSFEKIVFTDSGKLKLEKFFSKFGAESQEAYNYNINILSKNIDAYIDRQISPDDFKKQLEQYNKIFGAEIFDVKAILELQKPKTISSGKGADPDAW